MLLLWGTIFILLFTKVNKKGVVLLFGLIWAAMQLMSFWGVAIVIAIGAVIAELLWDKLDRRKFSTMLLCFTVQVIFLYLGMTLPLIFMKDMYLAAVSAYADLYSTVFDMLIGPMFFVGLAATVVGCIVGAFLGKLLLVIFVTAMQSMHVPKRWNDCVSCGIPIYSNSTR